MLDKLRIATRKSPLALRQAELVRSRLRRLYPGLQVELLGLTTRGDRIQDRPLAKVGGKGLFIKELEVALAEHRADLAVHSAKDLPAQLAEGFALAAILERETALDALVLAQANAGITGLAELPVRARVGTSSNRRKAQLLALRPDLRINPLRGNLQTRLARLDAGEHDALVLAAAGLERLNLGARISSLFAAEQLLPAPGQGALAVECLADAEELQRQLQPLNHAPTAIGVLAERKVARLLEASCEAAMAAHASLLANGELQLEARVYSRDGARRLQALRQGPLAEAEKLGCRVAQELLNAGAANLLG